MPVQSTRSSRTSRAAAPQPRRARAELPYKAMVRFAQSKGFTVTSTTGGKHNKNSLHGKGRAIDVRTRGKTAAQINAFIKAARAQGYRVKDERTRPPGQKVWSGPHLHLSK